ncbi:hypothetical protein IH824_09545 [candidate division KSB1 bacterium]|nr:hypothetical protein [candidate division KSB1 bacterium]
MYGSLETGGNPPPLQISPRAELIHRRQPIRAVANGRGRVERGRSMASPSSDRGGAYLTPLSMDGLEQTATIAGPGLVG